MLKEVLRSALKTAFYRPILESAGLGQTGDIERTRSVEELLRRLPVVSPPASGMYSAMLLSRGEPRPPMRDLFWPHPPAQRAAVLMERIRERAGVRVFWEAHLSSLLRFCPDTLAGPVSELRRLAEAAEDRAKRVPRPSQSVIAFSVLPQALLTEAVREQFWRVFQVPVFGQVLSPSLALLAWECEAHEGYHVQTDGAIFESISVGGEPELLVTSLVDRRRPVLRLATGLAGRLDRSACGCGLAGVRLAGLRKARPRGCFGELSTSRACAAG
jgi:hypothetical protein